MRGWIGGVMVIGLTGFSFALALGLAWALLRGVFRLLPSVAKVEAFPIRDAARPTARVSRNRAA